MTVCKMEMPRLEDWCGFFFSFNYFSAREAKGGGSTELDALYASSINTQLHPHVSTGDCPGRKSKVQEKGGGGKERNPPSHKVPALPPHTLLRSLHSFARYNANT